MRILVTIPNKIQIMYLRGISNNGSFQSLVTETFLFVLMKLTSLVSPLINNKSILQYLDTS